LLAGCGGIGVKQVTNLGSGGKNLVVLGDSIASGYDLPEEQAFPALLAARLPIPVLNAGVPGDTTHSALARLERDVLSRQPRIVLVELGGNDFLVRRPLAQVEADLTAIVTRIQASGAMVVLAGFELGLLGEDYGAVYERVAQQRRCLLVPDLLDGILGRHTSDQIHPDAEGHRLIAARLEPPLRELIAAADRERLVRLGRRNR
jgi:acyl-CoA thioesterase-1